MAEETLIYHYCSASTFIAIMKSKSIRLSDLNKTNDYQEKKWASRIIAQVLRERFESNGINFDLEEDYWYNDSSPNHLQYYKNEMNSILFNEKPIFISCFSQKGDLLSQWRAYGQDGTGLSIGFDYKKLKSLHKGKNILIEKVCYQEVSQKNKLGALIDNAISYMRTMFSEDQVKISEDFNVYFENEFDCFCEVLLDYIGQVGCTIKNPAFSQEKEIRVIYDANFPIHEVEGDWELSEAERFFHNTENVDDFVFKPIDYFYRDNQLVPYCDLDFSKLINQELIREIVIGPKCGFSEDDVYYFLFIHGFDANHINIRKSTATYR